MKKIKFWLIPLLISAVSGCAALGTSNTTTSPISSAKVFGEYGTSYDYVYLKPKDLFNHSNLVVTGEFSIKSRTVVVKEGEEPSLVSYYNFRIENVLRGTSIEKEIEVYAPGGTTTVLEYMSKAPETQWVASGIKNIGSKELPSFQKDGHIVDQQLIKYSLKDQFNMETGKKYLLFLGVQDNKAHRILGDRWGALIINNESITDYTDNSIIKIAELSNCVWQAIFLPVWKLRMLPPPMRLVSSFLSSELGNWVHHESAVAHDAQAGPRSPLSAFGRRISCSIRQRASWSL